MNVVCAVRDISFTHGREPVLTNVSFSAAPGEMTVLAGPNGAGKTTLLKILAGLLLPGRGESLLFGRATASLPARERARRVAYVPQLTQDDMPFTVRQMVSLGRAPWQNMLGLETDRDRAMVREALRCADLEHLADRPLSRLSGGERQRAGIARALCQQPELFLLDEPTAALDYGQQVRIMDLLDALRHQRNAAVVLASHDINLAAMYADKLLLIRNGHVAAHGAPAEVLTQEQIAFLYSCPILVDVNPCTRTPRVSPLPATRSG